MIVRRLAALALVLLTLPLLAQPAPPSIEREDEEEGCVEGRIRAYLERHGVAGRIDAETQLYVTREFQAALEREQREREVSAIAGSEWVSLGPSNGAGRATAVAFHPTAQGTAIIGAAGGGAWKTTDSGLTWQPLTETLADLSVGAIAYAPSNANRVYLGTGEGGIAGDFIPGIGLLVSDDGGATWTLPTSVLATQFFRLSVNPADPNDLIAATNLGVMRSKGGQNGPWTTTLQFSSSGGGQTQGYGSVADLVRDPSAPDTLYATTFDNRRWCVRNGCTDPFFYKSPRVVKSTNGGTSWQEVMTGLPLSTSSTRVSRIGIAIAPSETSRLYAALDTFDIVSGITTSHVYKSTNGGTSWSETSLATTASINSYLGTQAWYANTIVVSPTNADRVHVGGIRYAVTSNGGNTWDAAFSNVHVDCHDMRYDAANVLWIANDGGIWTSPDGTNGTDRNTGLVTRQFYTVANDPANRDRVFGGTQDNGTSRRAGSGTTWAQVVGGDGFDCPVNEDVSSIIYGTIQNGDIYRAANGGAASPIYLSRQPVWTSTDTPPFDTKVVIDPSTPTTLYTVSSRVWKSTTSGDAWTPLPTITADGSVWLDVTSTAFAVGRNDPKVMMVGKAGLLHYSANGGTTWSRGNGLPSRGINAIAIDPTNASVAWLALAGTTLPSLYQTTNGGATWIGRSTGLPPFSAQCVAFDPTDPETLYAGTDVGVYRSTDGGANWSRFGSGLPAVSVYDIQILRDGSKLRAATHGRGMWELVVNDVSNHAPEVTVASNPSATPVGGTLRIAFGAKVAFSGTFSDADGDPLAARWIFSDDFSSQPASSGGAPVEHTFYRAGRYPVTLNVRDSHGSIGAGVVDIVVAEGSDTCATPAVIPADGPFPYTIAFTNEGGSVQSSDPIGPTATGGCNQFNYQASNWFSFTPPANGSYTFSLCGSHGSGVVSVYTATTSCGPYVPVSGACLLRTGGTHGQGNVTCTSDSITTASLTGGRTYAIEVTNYFNQDYDVNALTIAPAGVAMNPVAIRITPATGGMSGGQSATITGSGFAFPGIAVAFDGIPATNVEVISPNLLTCTIPPHAAGTVNVSVTSGPTATLRAGFTYVAAPVPPRRRIVVR